MACGEGLLTFFGPWGVAGGWWRPTTRLVQASPNQKKLFTPMVLTFMVSAYGHLAHKQ